MQISRKCKKCSNSRSKNILSIINGIFFSSRRRHTSSVSAFLLNRSSDLGMKMLTMTNLSTECLIQLTKLGYDATPFNQILKQNAKREMRLRLGKVTVADVLAAQPVTTNLLK